VGGDSLFCAFSLMNHIISIMILAIMISLPFESY